MVKVKEIFTSIQGEGPLVGYKQVFIRLCDCNLHCSYCDTDFSADNAQEYTLDEIVDICNKHSDCHSVSITGGEPLLNFEFIKDLAQNISLPIYLETNGILYQNLEQVIDYIKYISADIKLPSAANIKPQWNMHDKFFQIASRKTLFAKVVFDRNITEEEILKITELGRKYDIEIVLQPMMINNSLSIDSDFMQSVMNKCLIHHKNTRLVPQVHKFLNII